MGKGSKRRPSFVDDRAMEEDWNRIFKREEKNAEKNRYKRGARRHDGKEG